MTIIAGCVLDNSRHRRGRHTRRSAFVQPHGVASALQAAGFAAAYCRVAISVCRWSRQHMSMSCCPAARFTLGKEDLTACRYKLVLGKEDLTACRYKLVPGKEDLTACRYKLVPGKEDLTACRYNFLLT